MALRAGTQGADSFSVLMMTKFGKGERATPWRKTAAKRAKRRSLMRPCVQSTSMRPRLDLTWPRLFAPRADPSWQQLPLHTEITAAVAAAS